MQRKGASFLITGEVLGQRPMSQHQSALNEIENASGVSDIIVRPLSAKVFKMSIPEQRGWIDRDRLFAMQGRSRKPQLALAKKLGIVSFRTELSKFICFIELLFYSNFHKSS